MTDETKWSDTVDLAQAYIARGDEIARLTRELAEANAERDAARQERDALRAMMPKPPYDADTLERAARGTYADRTVRGMARALLRLSPPSAPIDTRCGACIRAGRPGPCIECAYTGKAGS